MKKSHLYNQVVGDMKPTISPSYLYIMLSIALSILAIACINYVNLASAQSIKCTKSIALNKVYGAKPVSLFVQQITESVIMSVVSFEIALIITEQILPVFTQITGQCINLNYADITLVTYLIIFSIIIEILSGIYPGLVLSHKKPTETFSLKSRGKIKKIRIHKGFVVVQFFITILLVISALGIIKQTLFMKNYNVGFDKKNLLSIEAGQVKNWDKKYSQAKALQGRNTKICASIQI